MKLKKKHDFDSFQEIIDTPETEIVEEDIFIDENIIKNKDLVRIDMNLVQYPIFSKNPKRKANQIVKYFFNSNRDTYITIKPSAGDCIPGETEEKVFIALMKVMKEKGMPRKFIVSATDLKDELHLHTNRYGSIIRNSLLRLSETNYNFKNTMYSSDQKGVVKDEVSTPILTLKVRTLELIENRDLRNQFKDRRVKEVYEIEISDHFYNNIVQKGYLVYSSQILLDIETSTARTIYMLIEKLRFNKTYLNIEVLYLIKRIPLKFDKVMLSRTVETLKKSFLELKIKNLIQDFNIVKTSTWETAEIEIFFYEESKIEKQERFFDDFNDFKRITTNLTLSGMEHELIEQAIKETENKNIEILVEEKSEEIVITVEMVSEILELMPKGAKKLKTMPKTIQDSILKYGIEKVKAVAIYMKKNKVEKVRAYFLKALEEGWADSIVVESPKIPLNTFGSSKVSEDMDKFTNDQIQSLNTLYDEFEKMDKKIQDGIESYAYRDYIKKCGTETKLQKLAFLAGRKHIITEFLQKYPRIISKVEVPIEKESKKIINVSDNETKEEKEISVENLIKDPKELKDKIELGIELKCMINPVDDKEKLEIKKKVINEALGYITREGLTSEILESIINKYC